MEEAPNPSSAVQRARWLAELRSALDEALRIAATVRLTERPDAESRELWARLVSARAQVDGLQVARFETRDANEDHGHTDLPIWWMPVDRR